jgi:hypothetical protein
MTIPSQWSNSSIFRILTLYLVLVLYSAAYEYFYAAQLTTLFHDDYTTFDVSKPEIYTLICFLTPLAILPIGTRLRAPGQFIAGALAVFIFIPIPIVFAPMVTAAEFWRVYALLWLGYLAVCSLSSLAVQVPLPAVSERRFGEVVFMLFLLIGLGFVYVLATNHVAIVSLDQAHAAQKDVTVSGLQGYMLVGYISSFGGLLVAVAIMFRKYYLLLLALAGFACCYATLSERSAVLMPGWIAYVCVAHKFFFRDSVTKYLLTAMAPLFCGVLLAAFLGLEDRKSFLYDAFTLANYRLYSVPAISFNVYYNFFATHPLTYWSHIGFISNFVAYPYGQPLSLVMAEAYRLGNNNASFLETDGVAAAGTVMLPFISIIFGLVLVAINSCLRGLNVTLCAIVMAGSSVSLMDTGLGPGLLTNGLALLTLVLSFAPRSASWNLRYLHRFQPRPASGDV